jgi:hypothetical protein
LVGAGWLTEAATSAAALAFTRNGSGQSSISNRHRSRINDHKIINESVISNQQSTITTQPARDRWSLDLSHSRTGRLRSGVHASSTFIQNWKTPETLRDTSLERRGRV